MCCNFSGRDWRCLHRFERILEQDTTSKTAEYVYQTCVNYATLINGETGEQELARRFLSCAWKASCRMPNDERQRGQEKIQRIAARITEK